MSRLILRHFGTGPTILNKISAKLPSNLKNLFAWEGGRVWLLDLTRKKYVLEVYFL